MTSGTGHTRRELLALSGAAGLAGLAGCTGGNGLGSHSGFDGPGDVPATGRSVPALANFDETVRSFMADHDVPGGVLGVAKDGQPLLQRGYGHRDPERSVRTTPDTLVRIASLSKAFARAAVRKLMGEGLLQSAQPAFPLLDYEPLPGETKNSRLDDVTVGQLLAHQGGWNREEAYDPLFVQIDLAIERGWEEPPTQRQLIRYMVSEPLQFEPGTDRNYSNFGYLVLGHLVERVTGLSYEQYLKRDLLDPLGVSGVSMGRSLPRDRPDRETWYFDEMVCRNVVEMKPTELVPCPDGGFHQETTGASGGLVATVGDLLSFMAGYWLDGRPRERGDIRQWIFNGTLPGTFSLAIQHEGVDVAVIFNQRGYDPNYHGLRPALLDVIEATDEWPSGPP